MEFLRKIVLIFIATTILSACTDVEVPDVLQKQQKAGLQVVTSNEKPVSLFLNSVFLGKTPFIEKELQPGSFTLEIQPDDESLAPYETTINLQSGTLSVVTWKPEIRPELSGGVIIEMKKLPDSANTSQIAFETIPEGAIITLSGGKKEFSPVLLQQIQPGHHEFEVSLPSYETQHHTINVEEGYQTIIKIKLAKLQPTPTEEKPAQEPQLSASESADLTSITTATITAKVKITPTGFFQDGLESLRVRTKPGVTGETLGFVTVGSTVPFVEKNSDNWYKILFEDTEGWVSGNYVEEPK